MCMVLGLQVNGGELVYKDESNASNKYSMRLCVKTRVHHLLAKLFKVILEGKVSVVHVKEVTGWVPDFREDDIAQSEDVLLMNIILWITENPPNHVENSLGQMENSSNHVENFNVHLEKSHQQLENSPDHVENSHVHGENSTEKMENSPDQVENSSVHVESSHVHLENSLDLSGDLFSLEKIILESEKTHQCISFLGTIESVPKNISPGDSIHDHVDSLAPSPKLINGFPILECFQEFSSIGQAMDFAFVVEHSWNNDGVHVSNAMILLKNKLKSLKQTLKTWSIQKKSIREHDHRVLQDYLLKIDLRLDKGEGLPDDLPNRTKTFHDIGVINRKIFVDMAQKAKVKWVIEGD
ncbi:hypothetical protein Tco_0833460 [Tanacetum coccineum]